MIVPTARTAAIAPSGWSANASEITTRHNADIAFRLCAKLISIAGTNIKVGCSEMEPMRSHRDAPADVAPNTVVPSTINVSAIQARGLMLRFVAPKKQPMPIAVAHTLLTEKVNGAPELCR